jgi:two-component system, LytTR family, sensor kinase
MKRSGLLVLGIATGVGLLATSQLFIVRMGDEVPYTFVHALIMSMPNVYLWALTVPLIAYLLLRFPRNYLLHIAFAIGIIVARSAFFVWFMHTIGHGYPQDHTFMPYLQMELRYSGLVHLFTYIMIAVAILAFRSYRALRNRELEASQLSEQLAQAQLQALRMQIHPHFLFNALNAVNMLIRAGDKTRAVQAVTGLSELLRHVVDGAPLQEVRLQDELKFLERYLNIEQVRFGERLQVAQNIEPAAANALVPNLVLQPIVENAIRHGIAERTGSGRIDISAVRENGSLVMTVKDDGAGITPRYKEGVGLSNTRARLQRLYGEAHGLTVEAAPDGGTLATVRIPFRS